MWTINLNQLLQVSLLLLTFLCPIKIKAFQPSSSSSSSLINSSKTWKSLLEITGPCHSRKNVAAPHKAKSNERNNNHDDGHNHDRNHDNNDNPNNDRKPTTLVDTYAPILNKRLNKLRADILEEQLHKPPNPNLSPEEVITLLLDELKSTSRSIKNSGGDGTDSNGNHGSSPTSSISSSNIESSTLPDSGFRTLLRTSTDNWKKALRQSVGAPIDDSSSGSSSNSRNNSRSAVTEEQLVSALSSAMSRPNNQYQILVPDDENEDSIEGEEKYHLYFPGDVFEYDDGKAWVETQLRHPKTGKLLAILAWSLVQRTSDGAWLVDWLDWQDFRDEFRPGIGREEWSRICG